MRQITFIHKEIRVLLFAFVVLAIISVGAVLFINSEIKAINRITADIYNHPLQVSNASLALQREVYKIHRNMKDIVLVPPSQDLMYLIDAVNTSEQRAFLNLKIIEENILGDVGKNLAKETKALFHAWKPIRDEVVLHVKASENTKAVAITQGKGAEHVIALEDSASKLYQYARNKASEFKEESHTMFERAEIFTLLAIALLLLLFIVVAYYALHRISKYLTKNEHLHTLLAMIRDVNQMIVREKNKEVLIRHSCDILNSKTLFSNVRIMLCEEEHTTVKTTFYDNRYTYKIILQHGDTVYGCLTLTLNDAAFNHDEILLLEEVAGDIGYALYNLETEERSKANEKRYRELFDNIQSAAAIYRVEENGQKFVFEDINHAAEVIENIDKASTIGKDVKEVFSGIDAFGLLDVFKRVHKTGKAEWFESKEYRDERISGWRENYVYRLPSGEIVALYSDQTAEKRLEATLQQNEERYRFAIEAATDGLWDWDLPNNTLYFSPRWKEILGYGDDELENTHETWERHLHPDDKEKAFSAIKASHEKASGDYRTVFRLKHKAGHWVWIESRGKTLFDENGKAVRMIGSHTDVTKQKEAEEALIVSNEKFKKAFNKTPNIIVITHLKTGKIYDINRAFEKIIGYTKDEVIGKTTFDINLWKDFKDRKSYIQHLVQNGSTEGREYAFNAKDGSTVIAEVYASIVLIDKEKYILAVANDITQRLATEETLAQSHRQMSALMQNLPGMAYRCPNDATWPFEFVSEGCAVLTGYSASDFTNRKVLTYAQVIHPEDRQRIWSEVQEALLKKEAFELDYRIITADGSVKWVWEKGVGLYDEAGNIVNLEGVILDNNARKEAEKALKEQEMLLIAQSRLAAMGEMISMIAHQWRQPLTVVSMNASNILLDIELEEFSAASAEKYCHGIIDQTNYLSKTIDDFRNYFKPDKALLKTRIRPVVEETLSIVKDSLKNHHINWEASYESESEVDAYPRELMQVFVNIINNAKDALILSNKKDALIKIHVYEDEAYVITEICDNAQGIDEAYMSKIFDPYFTTKDERNGTGLGLYMSKMIIEEHLHGVIEVINSSSGACFKVKLFKEKTDSP